MTRCTFPKHSETLRERNAHLDIYVQRFEMVCLCPHLMLISFFNYQLMNQRLYLLVVNCCILLTSMYLCPFELNEFSKTHTNAG